MQWDDDAMGRCRNEHHGHEGKQVYHEVLMISQLYRLNIIKFITLRCVRNRLSNLLRYPLAQLLSRQAERLWPQAEDSASIAQPSTFFLSCPETNQTKYSWNYARLLLTWPDRLSHGKVNPQGQSPAAFDYAPRCPLLIYNYRTQ